MPPWLFRVKAWGSTRGAARAPSKILGKENARPVPGILRIFRDLCLGIAFLLSDEGFQKTLRLEVGIPNLSKGRMLTP
jgi:hypothetical protein